MSECCLKGFQWNGEPIGRETVVNGQKTYVTGSNQQVAILVIHDIFGWTFTNLRLLADHYAEEAKATVFLPDFFGGEVLPFETLKYPSRWKDLDMVGFISRNTKAIREPEIVGFAKFLRSQYHRVGAVGFCFGGWAVFRLGAAGNNLVDCISTAHPTWLTKLEIENVAVPVQILAPEFDTQFTQELRQFCHQKIPALNLPFDLQYFPGVEHAFATRGDDSNEREMRAMERGKNVAVQWFHQWLHSANVEA